MIQLTQEQVQGLVWEPYEITEDFIRSRAIYGYDAAGMPVYAIQTAPRGSLEFLEALVTERNDNEGKRWSEGSGSDKGGNMPLVKAGSVPLNVWFKHFANGQAADRDKKKWFWKQDWAQPFKVRDF